MTDTTPTQGEKLLASALATIERMTEERSKLLAERARLSREIEQWIECVHHHRDGLYTLLNRQTHKGICQLSETDLRTGISNLEKTLARLELRCNCAFNAGHEPTCALVKARERSAAQ